MSVMLQLFGGGVNILYTLIWYIPFMLFIFYGQRLQTWMILNDVGSSMNKLKIKKERSRKEALEYDEKI